MDIYKACMEGETGYVIEYFKKEKAKGKSKGVNMEKGILLILACERNQIGTAVALMEMGADVQAQNNRPMDVASRWGYAELLKLLIKRGANIHGWEEEPLRRASLKGQIEIVEILLEAGADPSALNHEAERLARQEGCGYTAALLLSYRV